jgi:hypothetical protein
MQNEMKVPQDQALLFGHNPENQEDFPLFGRKWGKNEDWVTAMVNWVQEKTKNPKFDYLTHKITTRERNFVWKNYLSKTQSNFAMTHLRSAKTGTNPRLVASFLGDIGMRSP